MEREGMTEPKRVKAFRLAIAKQIPKFPNNEASLQALETKSLGSLLIDYANWAIRYIAPRPRVVIVEQYASGDPRWQALGNDIATLLEKVEQGEDLTPYLSLQLRTRGFTPAASAQGPNVDRWADKDMLLNVMGYHHLHLDAAPSNQMRSDDVLFAHVTRELFTVVAISDHTVFDTIKPNATAERERLWAIFDERSTRGIALGQIVRATPIALSGHALYFTQLAAKYARLVTALDPKLDELTFVRGFYEGASVPVPAKPKVRWHLEFLTLGLVDLQEFFSRSARARIEAGKPTWVSREGALCEGKRGTGLVLPDVAKPDHDRGTTEPKWAEADRVVGA